MIAVETRYRPCGCGGNDDSCGTCFGTGSYRVAEPAAPVQVRPAYIAPSYAGRFLLCTARDGWAKSADGFLYPRWALCLSYDGIAPAHRYKNRGPVAIVKTTAAKVAPDWHGRAIEYAAGEGGLTADVAAIVAEWYRKNRVGQFGAAMVAK